MVFCALLCSVQTLTEELTHRGLADQLLTEADLAWLLDGTPQRRHHLVNRAMKAGELIQVRRGRYVLSERYRHTRPHPFALAQAFVPGSYVSFETALAHHGWIPEAVRVTASVTPGRKSLTAEHPTFGSFSFHPLAIQHGYFLELVEHIEIEKQSMLVAKPIRALADLVASSKRAWQGLGWLTDGLRIEEESLQSITSADIELLIQVYRYKRVAAFVRSLAKELRL